MSASSQSDRFYLTILSYDKDWPQELSKMVDFKVSLLCPPVKVYKDGQMINLSVTGVGVYTLSRRVRFVAPEKLRGFSGGESYGTGKLRFPVNLIDWNAPRSSFPAIVKV